MKNYIKYVSLFLVALIVTMALVSNTQAQTTWTLTLTSPNGGERWAVGTDMTINWRLNGSSVSDNAKIRVNLLDDKGMVYDNIVGIPYSTNNKCKLDQEGTTGDCIKLNSGTAKIHLASWNPTGKFKLEISCFTRNEIGFGYDYCPGISADRSNSFFDIVATPSDPAPSIEIIYPNGGENLIKGNISNIKWKSVGLSRYDLIRATLLNSSGSSIVIDDALNNNQYVDWLVRQDPGQYKISLCVLLTSMTGCGSTVDTSDNFFSIGYDTQTVSIVDPLAEYSFIDNGSNDPVRAQVAFNFNIYNSSASDIYVSKDSNIFFATSLTPGTIVNMNPIGSAISSLPNDTYSAFVVKGGMSRRFYYNGIIDNTSGTAGLKQYIINQINYGITSNNPTGLTITSRLDNLRLLITLGGLAVIKDTQSPSVPNNLVGMVVSSDQINLTWNPSIDDTAVTGYNIYRDGSLFSSVTGTSYNNVGLPANTKYTYSVSAYDNSGNISAQSPVIQVSTKAKDITKPDKFETKFKPIQPSYLRNESSGGSSSGGGSAPAPAPTPAPAPSITPSTETSTIWDAIVNWFKSN